MERPVGDKFEVNGRVYVVVRDGGTEWPCTECAMVNDCNCKTSVRSVTGECFGWKRRDRINVHFEGVADDVQSPVQKGGE